MAGWDNQMCAVSQSSLLLITKLSVYAADFLRVSHGSKNTSKGDKGAKPGIAILGVKKIFA